MNQKDLIIRLHAIAREGVKEANRNNPFWSKSQAMTSLNNSRNLFKLV